MSDIKLLPPAPTTVPAATEPIKPSPAPRPGPQGRVQSRAPKLFAFASGKGGVGKSLLAANLGIQLARQGRTVTLLDSDLASSTLHSYLGAGASQACLDDLLAGRNISLASLARDTSVPGLRLIAGPRAGWGATPPAEQLERLALQAYEMPSDCVLIDLPSGRHPLSLALLALADYGVLVTTPEPSSLEGGFRLVEELARQALDRPDPAQRRAAEAALGQETVAKGPAALLDSLAEVDPALANSLGERLARLKLIFIINQSRSDGEAQLGLNLRSLCRHYLGVEMEFGGVVEFDLSAWQATRQRKSLSQKYPNAPATRTIEQIAGSLLTRPAPLAPPPPRWMPLAERTLYEVLEVPPGATQRDLQRAYDRLQSVVGPEAETLGGAVHPDRVRTVRARVETAYRTLVFLESRSEYDRSLLAAGRVRAEELRDLSLESAAAGARSAPHAAPARRGGRGAAAGSPAAAAPASASGPLAVSESPSAGGAGSTHPRLIDPTPPPEVGGAGAAAAPLTYSGPLLATLRRERGLSLEAIAAVSKVRTNHLRCVEEERFAELPAPVFLKGFVREFARCLSLDSERVWQDYLARYQEWKRRRDGA